MEANTVTLPKNIGVWIRSDSPRAVTSDNILRFMNGAGELYLGFRFNRLDVFDYTYEGQDTSLVPLFAGGTEVDRLTYDVDKTDIE